eukprot:1160581-Pelagomonas_calceolata.AAC.7
MAKQGLWLCAHGHRAASSHKHLAPGPPVSSLFMLRSTGQSKGFGFVRMATEQQAATSIERLNLYLVSPCPVLAGWGTSHSLAAAPFVRLSHPACVQPCISCMYGLSQTPVFATLTSVTNNRLKGLQGVGLQPETLADRSLKLPQPAPKMETSTDKNFGSLYGS